MRIARFCAEIHKSSPLKGTISREMPVYIVVGHMWVGKMDASIYPTFYVACKRHLKQYKGEMAMANPGDRFDRFTQRARNVLTLAQEEAQRLRHNYIGTEHLLLGLVREGNGLAAGVLMEMGVDLREIRNRIEAIIGRGDRIVLGEIGLTPRAKKVIELAVDEARRLNHHYVGTEHLLLGLIREGDGIGADVLKGLGVDLNSVRLEVMRAIAHLPTKGPVRRVARPFVVALTTVIITTVISRVLRKRLPHF